jgi:hypothetical protein
MCGCRKKAAAAAAPAPPAPAPRVVAPAPTGRRSQPAAAAPRRVQQRAPTVHVRVSAPNRVIRPAAVPPRRMPFLLRRRAPAPAPVPAPAPSELPPERTKAGLLIHDTAVWGPPLWKVLHTLAESPAVASIWADIPAALDVSLPCPECEEHYHAWLTAHPCPVADADGIRTWLRDLHNTVNARNGKPTWTAEEVTAAYRDADVRPALESLRGILGEPAWMALDAAAKTPAEAATESPTQTVTETPEETVTESPAEVVTVTESPVETVAETPVE